MLDFTAFYKKYWFWKRKKQASMVFSVEQCIRFIRQMLFTTVKDSALDE